MVTNYKHIKKEMGKLVMNVLVKSSNGITQVSADAKLLSQRKVFITG